MNQPAAPPHVRSAPPFGGRLLILIGVSIGLMLLGRFIGERIPVDLTGQSPARDAVAGLLHHAVLFCASVVDWSLFGVLVFMIVRWTLGAPIAEALRS